MYMPPPPLLPAFQKDLSSLGGDKDLHPTIPRFHDMRLRYEQLEEALKQDVAQRSSETIEEIEFYMDRKDGYCVLEDMRAEGALPTRLCHNDTKINNILIDEHAAEGIAVIDLDTVMPGTILYDFGDLGRTCLSNSTEDETDTQRIQARMDYFEAMVEGFLTEWGNSLTDIEVSLLAFAPRIMTLIIGLRFLTDYLNGDVYFKTHSAQHNLERSRAHIALVKSMEKTGRSHEPDCRECNWQTRLKILSFLEAFKKFLKALVNHLDHEYSYLRTSLYLGVLPSHCPVKECG